jgi:vanillate O-demethylase monooxygenase subunit
MERTVCDEPLLLYRTEAGRAVVLHGLCPHRWLPLSRGCLIGDEVMCGYHGIQFDATGRCTKIPTQATPPAAFRLRTFPVAEQGGFVWAWMGDAARAETSTLPDISAIGMGAAGWANSCHDHVHLKARWSLLMDNLFDLSHIGWVHARTIGMSPVVMVPPVLEEGADTFIVTRKVHQCPTDSFHRWLYPQASDTLNLELYTELTSPGIINAGSRAFNAGDGGLLGNLNFIHIVTPETAHSCHYFTVVTRDFRVDDEALGVGLGVQVSAVREEDRVTLEAIEPRLDRFADARRELSGQVDAGAIRLRRHFETLLKTEQAQVAPA